MGNLSCDAIESLSVEEKDTKPAGRRNEIKPGAKVAAKPVPAESTSEYTSDVSSDQDLIKKQDSPELRAPKPLPHQPIARSLTDSAKRREGPQSQTSYPEPVIRVDSAPSPFIPTDQPESARARNELLRANTLGGGSATATTVRSRSWGKQATKDEPSPSVESSREKERANPKKEGPIAVKETASPSLPPVREKLLTPSATIRYDSPSKNESEHTALQDMFNQPPNELERKSSANNKGLLLPRSLSQKSEPDKPSKDANNHDLSAMEFYDATKSPKKLKDIGAGGTVRLKKAGQSLMKTLHVGKKDKSGQKFHSDTFYSLSTSSRDNSHTVSSSKESSVDGSDHDGTKTKRLPKRRNSKSHKKASSSESADGGENHHECVIRNVSHDLLRDDFFTEPTNKMNVLDGDQAEEAGEAGEGEDDPPIIIPIPSEPRERRRETKRERTLEREKSKGAQPVEPGVNQDASFFDALALKLAEQEKYWSDLANGVATESMKQSAQAMMNDFMSVISQIQSTEPAPTTTPTASSKPTPEKAENPSPKTNNNNSQLMSAFDGSISIDETGMDAFQENAKFQERCNVRRDPIWGDDDPFFPKTETTSPTKSSKSEDKHAKKQEMRDQREQKKKEEEWRREREKRENEEKQAALAREKQKDKEREERVKKREKDRRDIERGVMPGTTRQKQMHKPKPVSDRHFRDQQRELQSTQDVLSEVKMMLIARGEKIDRLDNTTEEIATEAAKFKGLATELREEMERRKGIRAIFPYL